MAQLGNHTVKSGSTLQSFTALSVGEAKFYALVKGGEVGQSLRSAHMDLGIHMKVEIQSDRRIGEQDRERVQERVLDGDLSIKKVSQSLLLY